MCRQMTTANHVARVATPAQVTAQAAQVVTVRQRHAVLQAVHALPARPWAPTPRQLMAATSRQKLLLVVMPRKPPLSASAKPRQLQQLTVPRLSNRLEQRRI